MSNGISTLFRRPRRRPVGSPPPPLGRRTSPWIDPGLKVLIPALLIVFLVLAVKFGSFQAYLQLLSRQTYASFLPALGAGYTLVMLIFQLGRTILWARYQPYPPADGPLPFLTVIIPAYNEGAMVEKAITSVAASDYPAHRLEIICIDDGSTDDTWLAIQRAQERYPHLLKTIRFAVNRGKKEGLYAGFTRGRGDIFVTIDSDSIIAPDALRHLVAPLLHDELIGAVAGNVKVYNRNQSLMGKMQGVRFVNLDYLRASQSLYRAVVCTPGSLSAYRRAALMPHLPAWRRQTFLGAPCHHSEDRARPILSLGPATIPIINGRLWSILWSQKLIKACAGCICAGSGAMCGESLVQLGYLFTRYREKYRLLPIVEFFLAQLEYPLTLLFFGVLVASAVVYPLILIKLLAALGVVSLLNLFYYLWLERDLEFIYGVIYAYYAFFLLQWIYPYACLTVRNRHWLTRATARSPLRAG